jgi:hypothetical protein
LIVAGGYLFLAIYITVAVFTGYWIVSNEFVSFQSKPFEAVGPFAVCGSSGTDCSNIDTCTDYFTSDDCDKFVNPVRAMLIVCVVVVWLHVLYMGFLWFTHRGKVIESVKGVVLLCALSCISAIVDLAAWAHWTRFYIETYVDTSDPETPVLGWSYGMMVSSTMFFFIGSILVCCLVIQIRKAARSASTGADE